MIKSFEKFIHESKITQIAEMALADVNVQAILKDFDKADKKRKEEISEEISGTSHQDRNRIIKDLSEFDYEETKDVMKKLGIDF
jgi:cobyrinic acid a,c-diamide synthase